MTIVMCHVGSFVAWKIGWAPEAIAQQVAAQLGPTPRRHSHRPLTARRRDANSSISGSGDDKLPKVVDAESNGAADPDRLELAAAHEMVNRGTAEAEHLARLPDGHEQWRWGSRRSRTVGGTITDETARVVLEVLEADDPRPRALADSIRRVAPDLIAEPARIVIGYRQQREVSRVGLDLEI
jgi:hypothetical protein